MEYRDYYKVLGIERDAGAKEIRAAFRQLAMKYHPDRNSGNKIAEEKFIAINEAYEVLGDEERRARYDRLGNSYKQWAQSGKKGNFNWDEWFAKNQASTSKVSQSKDSSPGSVSSGTGFSEFFTTIFGNLRSAQRSSGSERGQRSSNSKTQSRTYQHNISISLLEAFNGTERTVQVEGRLIKVKVPPGSQTGTKVRMEKAGPVGPNGQKMDIYLHVTVDSHPQFERKDEDLYTDIYLDLYTAVLGGQVSVKTIESVVLLTVPAGTQPGQTFRLVGQGMPKLRTPKSRGNLFVKVKILVPRNITQEERIHYEALRLLQQN